MKDYTHRYPVSVVCAAGGSGHLHMGKVFHRLLDRFDWIFVILQLSAQIRLIRAHVKIAVTGKIEEDHALLALCFGVKRFIHRGANRMGRLWGWDNSLCPGKLDRSVEGWDLFDRHCFNMTRIIQSADARRHAVIAQAARMDPGRNEIMTQRMHFDNGRHSSGITIVECVYTLG